MVTKVGLVIVIASMVTAIINQLNGAPYCSWWMYWVMATIAFICLLGNYISNRLVENGWDLMSRYDLDEELEQEVHDMVNKFEMKIREREQNKDKNNDEED